MKRAAFIVVLAAASALAQQPYMETFELRLHNLDVVVTDAKGQPVRGLTKDDFIVLEDGAPQDVTNFSVYDTGAASHEPAEDMTPEPKQPRRFIFFVDEMSLRKQVRDALIRDATALIDQLEENDLVAVVRPTGHTRMPQPFTTDTKAARAVLSDAIESCKLSFLASRGWSTRTLNSGLENARGEGDARYAVREYVQSEQERVWQRLAHLRALIASMAGVEGRKVLVVLTEGLSSIPGREVLDPLGDRGMQPTVADWSAKAGDLNSLIDELGRMAAANGVTIYALEPELSFDTTIRRIATNEDKLRRSDRQALAEPIVPKDSHGDRMHHQAQTLRSLSERTGGRWYRGAASIDDVFRQVATDLATYYSMAYRATGEENKPRRVTVQVRNRPDLTVRTRTEVIERSKEREMGDLVASTLLFPRHVNELRIALYTGKPKRKGSLVTIPLDVVIPLDTLTFVRTGNDRYAAMLDIHHSVAGLERPFSSTGRHRENIEISEDQYRRRKGLHHRFKTGVEVWRGKTRVAIGVMDPVSHLVGFRSADVNAQ